MPESIPYPPLTKPPRGTHKHGAGPADGLAGSRECAAVADRLGSSPPMYTAPQL